MLEVCNSSDSAMKSTMINEPMLKADGNHRTRVSSSKAFHPLFDVLPRFYEDKNRRFWSAINRLSIVTLTFAASFILTALIMNSNPFLEDIDYISIYGSLSSIPLLSTIFCFLFASYGIRILIYLNILLNLLSIIATLAYLLHFAGLKYRQEYAFQYDVPFQAAVSIYLAAAIAIFVLHLLYSARVELFKAKFYVQLQLNDVKEKTSVSKATPQKINTKQAQIKDKQVNKVDH